MSGFVPATEYKLDKITDDEPTLDDDAPSESVVPGYECPMSGYILTAEAIAKGYCKKQGCVRHVRRDMVDGCRTVA
jgi:hypothetical protein